MVLLLQVLRPWACSCACMCTLVLVYLYMSMNVFVLPIAVCYPKQSEQTSHSGALKAAGRALMHIRMHATSNKKQRKKLI